MNNISKYVVVSLGHLLCLIGRTVVQLQDKNPTQIMQGRQNAAHFGKMVFSEGGYLHHRFRVSGSATGSGSTEVSGQTKHELTGS